MDSYSQSRLSPKYHANIPLWADIYGAHMPTVPLSILNTRTCICPRAHYSFQIGSGRGRRDHT
jgi:hypothetical protein